MNRLVRGLAALALVTTPLVAAAPAHASSSTCNDGTRTDISFYNAGGGAANINESTAIRYRSERTSAGTFYVSGWSGDGATGNYNEYTGSQSYSWVGRWSTNSPFLTNSVKVTNYGGGSTFYYNRSCTLV